MLLFMAPPPCELWKRSHARRSAGIATGAGIERGAGPAGATYSEAVRIARAAALDELEPFLQSIRSVPGLVERKRGVFYRRSRAFLHFHEDPSGMHADVRLGETFERVRVQTNEERNALLERIRSVQTPGT
jgi:hypothetical protein